MKVFEIITEAGAPRGPLGVFYRMLPDSTQKLVAGELESALAWMSKKIKGQPVDVATKDLAESWAVASQKTGVPLDDIMALGEAEAKKLKIDPKIIADAKAQAAAIKKAGDDAAALANRPGTLTRTVNALGPLSDTIIKWGTVWGIAEPIYNCSTKIARAYELNKSGDPEWQGQKLHGAIQFYLDDCVAEVGAILASRTISIAMFKAPGWIMPAPLLNVLSKYAPKPMQSIYQNIAGMTKVAEAAWIAWIGTPQGRDWLAKFLVSGSLIAMPFNFVRNYVSSWVKSGYDVIADKLVDPSQRSIPKPETPYQGAKRIGVDMATGNRIR